ncbi:MAG: TfoX/Sxy family protein [Nocardioidaceae bacterium]|nr:TfoX/Sxy family protein [Nocardioidaceae bacterium]NUS51877.1 TfoX/Sxy family protein [Nocardioidaceae bacterium]
MEKATEAGRAWFDELLPPDDDVTRRPMFGNLAGFVNGNMFLCLFGDDVAVRLAEADQAELLDAGGRPFEPMAGRPMKEYVVLPASYREDLAESASWVARSLEHTRAMPPKQKKPAKKG